MCYVFVVGGKRMQWVAVLKEILREKRSNSKFFPPNFVFEFSHARRAVILEVRSCSILMTKRPLFLTKVSRKHAPNLSRKTISYPGQFSDN